MEIQSLPPVSDLLPSTLSFLDKKFLNEDDLNQAPTIVSELQNHCSVLEKTRAYLNQRLGSGLAAHASRSGEINGRFNKISAELDQLKCYTSPLDGAEGEGFRRGEQVLGQELPALAREIGRLENVRAYAETALKLNSLVGDMENAVSSLVEKNLRERLSAHASDELCLLAIESLKLTENLLSSVMKTRPQWLHFISSVDHRVDRALAVLRPQTIADHRAILASLGWPPPLATLSSINSNASKWYQNPNPLLIMDDDLKDRYCGNFLALCRLQELQIKRKSRQLEGYNREIAVRQPLWVIEELVNPLSIASQQHFPKWVDKPEFIFALVYKMTRDNADSMDELLQPLVDKAKLTGYSCREEWTSAMVSSLSTYLAKEVFPIYVSRIDEDETEGVACLQSRARISWLHLVDSMIAFDKRIQSLVAGSGITLFLQEEKNLRKISSLSIFCDRPDWLDIWAKIELDSILVKLKEETEDERNWIKKINGFVFLGPVEYKAPKICDTFLQHLSTVVNCCQSLPSPSLRSRFIRSAGAPVIQKHLECVLLRCQEAEGLTALTHDDALVKVANSINAARYIESALKEWYGDIFFVELAISGGESETESNIFCEEIGKLEEFREEWIEKISIVLLRGFRAPCRDYMNERKQRREKTALSKPLIDGLDYLRGKLTVLGGSLNGMDFVTAWRSIATGVDRLIFEGVFTSNEKFYDVGVERLGGDMEVLFGVFGVWCMRPESFFPRLSESLRLLRMEERQLQGSLVGGEEWLKEHGIGHLNVAEVEKIARSRVFVG